MVSFINKNNIYLYRELPNQLSSLFGKMEIKYKDILFKQISEFKDYYISRCGKCLSYKKQFGTYIRLLTPIYTKKGYIEYAFYNNGCTYRRKAHRLVAHVFIPNIVNKPQINHKNGIRDDNRVENLEWCTNQENIKHSFDKLGRKSSNYNKFGKNNNRTKQVLQLDIDGNVVKKWDSMSDIQKKLGYSVSSVSRWCNNQAKLRNNFIWRFE